MENNEAGKIKVILFENYNQEMEELRDLDEMMLKYDYSEYNDLITKKTETIIDRILENEQEYKMITSHLNMFDKWNHATMSVLQKKVVKEAVIDILYTTIDETVKYEM